MHESAGRKRGDGSFRIHTNEMARIARAILRHGGVYRDAEAA